MKIVGLITEYNPFHNGHLHHIREAKRVTGADAAIVVMSGDYVQRGVPAFMPKRLRTEMALKCGASAVFELPVCYATGSAEYFALGAVSLLDSLGIVDAVCFGSECNDLDALSHVADILTREPDDYRSLLKKSLKKGVSFPSARHEAMLEYTRVPAYAALLDDPNNILGIEYLKSLKKLNSRMIPFTIQREGAHYHDRVLSPGRLSSASAIRSLLAFSGSSLHTDPTGGTFENTSFENILSELEDQVPSCCLELLEDFHRVQYPVYQNDLSLLLKYKLLNKTVKKVTEDTEALAFNTAISQMMVFVNELNRLDTIPKKALETLTLLLSPYTPHLAEELWVMLGHEPSVSKEKWPEYDESKTIDDEIEIVVQVNGKVRAKMQLPRSASKDEMLSAAKSNEKIQGWIDGKTVVKEIVVPGKLVNIVVK